MKMDHDLLGEETVYIFTSTLILMEGLCVMSVRVRDTLP